MRKKRMNKSLNFLLNKNEAEDYFNQKSRELFGTAGEVTILDINRSETYNQSSYNILYKMLISGQMKEIRASASEQLSKKEKYRLLIYIYENGFDKGKFLVAKPLGYFEDYNIMIYENVSGEPFMRELDDRQEDLVLKVKRCAQTLKKIHTLQKPDVSLWNADEFFEFKDLEKGALKIYYPKILDALDDIILQIKKRIDKRSLPVLCHGDFHPNNLIISEDQVYVLDFDLACFIDKEYDVANFVNQLRVMIKRYGDHKNFETLKKEFLFEYSQYDLEKYKHYEALVNLRILVTFCVSQGQEDNLEYIPFVYDQFQKNLKNIGINISDAGT